MKKLLMFLLLTSAIALGQTSEFNKRTVFNQGHQDSWIKDENGNEMRFHKPSVSGYTNSINQMDEVLDFYNLDSEDIVHEESYFPDGTKFGEFTQMHSGLKSGTIYIEKEWKNDEVSVSWICNKKFYCIAIKPIK